MPQSGRITKAGTELSLQLNSELSTELKRKTKGDFNMLEKGTKAPDFSLSDKDGNMVSLSQFAGKKVIVYFT